MWHPSDRLFTHLAADAPEPSADVSELPHTCSYCGSQEFGTPEDTGRGLRVICSACGGAMLRTEDGQWSPAGPGSTDNHPRPDPDPMTGGVGGAANVGADPDPMNDASARHSAARGDYQDNPWVMAKPGDEVPCPTCKGRGSYEEDELKPGAEHMPDDLPEEDYYHTVTHPCEDCETRGYHVRGTDTEEMAALRESEGRAAQHELHQFAEKHEDEDPHPGGVRQPSCPPECTYLTAEQKTKRDRLMAERERQQQGPLGARGMDNATSLAQGLGQHTADAEVPWCAHLYHGQCTYPGDKLPNGHILGIPQDRGPCPWKHNAFQQAACPISEPGPMAVMRISASLHEGSWADVREKAKRIRREGGVIIRVSSADGVAGEVQGDHHVYETAITWVPGTSRTAAWTCGCKWGAYAWGPTWDGRPCSHVLAMRLEAQSRSMYGRELQADEKAPDWLKPQTSIVTQFERPSEAHPSGRDLTRRAMPPGNMRTKWHGRSRTRRSKLEHTAQARALLAQDADAAEVIQQLVATGATRIEAQLAVLTARGRVAIQHMARKCPECGAELDSTAGQCADCGAVLPDRSVTHRAAQDGEGMGVAADMVPDGLDERTASWSDDEQRCPHCGGYLGPAAFKAGKCPHCGHALAHKTGALDEDRHYLRFGDWPKDERSLNHAEGYREEGVSVYDMHRGHPVVPGDEIGYGEFGNDTHEELQGRIDNWRRGRQPAHIVKGDVVGIGHDGEPLLRNLQHVRTLDPDEHELHPAWDEQIIKSDPQREGYGKTGSAGGCCSNGCSCGLGCGCATDCACGCDGEPAGWGGSQGPFESQYGDPHVYARDIHSGAGNCVCGGGLGDALHIQAAPGVDIPEHQRTGSIDLDYRPHRTQDARSDAPEFGKGVDSWGLTLVDCPQCGGQSGCGHCGGTGQVISTGDTTANATPDQNPVAGDAIREDGISDTSALHPQFAAKVTTPTHAGVALVAGDTGRVLMIQRSHKDKQDPARGRWEFPGGGAEESDRHSLDTATREFEEEVGTKFPTGGVVTHTWRSGPWQGHVVTVPSESAIDFSDGRSTVNPDDPDGDDHEQSAWWEVAHARKNPALRDEVKKTPWHKITSAPADAGLKVEALMARGEASWGDVTTLAPGREQGNTHEAAAWDSLYSLEESQPVTPPAHSTSENPASTGFLTTQDPASWSEVTKRPHHLMPADSLDSPLATLHDVPEGALPFTDGDLEDSTSGTADPYHGQTDTESLDGTTDTIPDVEMQGSPMENLGGIASRRSVAEIVEAFQRTAGAQALQSGSSEGSSSMGFSDSEIAAVARERLAGLSKTALKNFSPAEQRELIGEGQGSRARNFGNLQLEGTHYAPLQEALDGAGVADDDILIL